MISKDFYHELDILEKAGVNMAVDGVAMLHKAHPQIPILYLNKFMVDWIKERSNDVNGNISKENEA